MEASRIEKITKEYFNNFFYSYQITAMASMELP